VFIGSKNICSQQLGSVLEIFRIPCKQYKTQTWSSWTSCKCYTLPKGSIACWNNILHEKLNVYRQQLAIRNNTKESFFESEFLPCRLISILSKCNFTSNWSITRYSTCFSNMVIQLLQQDAKIQFLIRIWLHVNMCLIGTNFCTYICLCGLYPSVLLPVLLRNVRLTAVMCLIAVHKLICTFIYLGKNPDDGQSPKTQYLCVLYTIVRTL
jgi:hypothetical protein